MSQRPDTRAGELPKTAMITACEAITWVAFRRAVTWEQFWTLFEVTADRWLHFPADCILEALEARAGLSGEGPSYATNWATRRQRDDDASEYPVFGRSGPAMLRWIRARRRQETGETLSFTDVAILLRDAMARDEATLARIEAAEARLRDRLAGGLLVAHGKAAKSDGEAIPGELMQQLDRTLFMHPAMIITESNELTINVKRPVEEWQNQRLPRFTDVQLEAAAVLSWTAPELGGGKILPALNAFVECDIPLDAAAAEALRVMTVLAEEAIIRQGVPPKRDHVVQMCNRQTGYPVAKARQLHRRLPDHLRNKSTKPRSST
jgi:hypothetical protein